MSTSRKAKDQTKSDGKAGSDTKKQLFAGYGILIVGRHHRF